MSSLKLSRLALFLVVVIGFVVSSNLHWGKDHWKQVLKVDARGYYAHLPAIFIYQDLQFNFFEELEMKTYLTPGVTYEYRTKTPEGTVNRYFSGTAILQAPFFLVARVWANLSAYPDDGYSKPFPLMITVAGLFYLWLGLWCLNRFLESFDIDEWVRFIVILAFAFGTHLFNYSIVNPGMSHVYSFALVCMFLMLGRQFFSSESRGVLISLALVLGLICLVRPINGIVFLCLPFVAGSWDVFKTGSKRLINNWRGLLISCFLFLSVVSFQLLLYKIQTGKFWVSSYGQEGFNWFDPQMIDILFSYKKGLFVYTPMLLLGMFGLKFIWNKNRFQAVTLISFLFVVVYVLSSWWSWWYGGSFSGRAFVEYLPFFVVPLAFLIQEASSKIRLAVLTLMFVFLALNQFQTYQYRYYIIHWDSMDKDRYWDVFLSLDKPGSEHH